MKQLCMLALCVVFGLSTAASADSEEALALAKEFIELSGAKEGMTQVVPAIMQQQKLMIRQKFGDTADPEKLAKAERMMQVFTEEMATDFEQLLDKIAELYASKFSVEDLTALRDFYASDVGQRFAKGNIELTADMAKFSQEWAIALIKRAQARIAEAE